MKILILSDSHGNSAVINKIMQKHPNVDTVFFLGDGAQEFLDLQKHYPSTPFLGVQGNCDPSSVLPLESLVKIKKTSFFFTHGHIYNVKQSLTPLFITAKKANANIALFGHTHLPYYEKRESLYLFNPGSVSYPRNEYASYGLLKITKEELSFSIMPVCDNNKKIKYVTPLLQKQKSEMLR